MSDLLWKELSHSMTSDLETVRMYGKVFSVDSRSPQEWDIYEEILRKDPDFAEIRFWYTNQYGWQSGSSDAEERSGYARALKSHLVIPALGYYPYRDGHDDVNDSVFIRQLDYARKIFPERHWREINQCLNIYRDELTMEEIDEMLGYAEIYQRGYNLLNNLAYLYYFHNQFEISIPLNLSAIYSRFLTGQGTYDWPLSMLGFCYTQLGYLAEGQIFCRRTLCNCDDDIQAKTLYYLAVNLREQFRFREAADLYREAYISLQEDFMLCAAYMCLFEAGDIQAAKKWLKDRKTKPDVQSVQTIIRARFALAKGNFDEAQQLIEEVPFERVGSSIDERIQIEAEIVKIDIALLRGAKSKARVPVLYSCFLNPRSRRTALLLELYTTGVGHLGEAFTVTTFMFPEQEYWQKKLEGIKDAGFIDISDDELIQVYEEGMKRYKECPSEKMNFWFSAEPYLIEYICLRMGRMADKKLREKGMEFYLMYYNDWKDILETPAVHMRNFIMMVINELPEEERIRWLEMI
jgi:hypothetical protein